MFANVTLSLMGGFVTTIQLFCLTLVFALPLGLIISFGSMSRFTPLRALVKTVVWAVRGTPLMLQIIIIYYGPALVWGIKLPRFTAALVAFVINYACYFSEIFRGGIQAVPKGQTEAARSLGLSSAKTMLRVVLPQAFKIAIPSLVNQFIITVKDTSILSVIGLAEVVNRAKQYVGSTFSFFATYVYVGALYLVVISLLMVLSRRIEKRMSYDRKG